MSNQYNQYIRIICPMCWVKSPVCDQVADIHRNALNTWWQNHLQVNHPQPMPIFQVVSNEEGSYMECPVYAEHGACYCSTGVLGACAIGQHS